jgi:hypothetical protein
MGFQVQGFPSNATEADDHSPPRIKVHFWTFSLHFLLLFVTNTDSNFPELNDSKLSQK